MGCILVVFKAGTMAQKCAVNFGGRLMTRRERTAVSSARKLPVARNIILVRL